MPYAKAGSNPTRRVRAVLVAVALLSSPVLLPAQPLVDELAVQVGTREFVLDVASHRGFQAVRMGTIPGGLFSSPAVAALRITGRVGAEPVAFRIGSPFVRVGPRTMQMANAPYVAGGERWIPLDFFTRTVTGIDVGSGTAAPARGDMATVAPTRRSGPWRVAIDAGHGGHDPGTVSPRTGAREKDISLKLALLVAEELKSRGGIEPFLTREDDRFIRLEDRPKLAIAANADLFVSIHVNAQPRGSSASGFETYYLGQARSEMSRQVAMRENAVIELEGAGNRPNLDQLEFILAGLDRDVNLVESRRFAGYIQNGLRTALDSKDRGVKSNIFYVLLTTGSMPAVLVETGYITNPTDERRLTDENTQRKIARALADTIETYFKDTGRRLQAVESD